LLVLASLHFFKDSKSRNIMHHKSQLPASLTIALLATLTAACTSVAPKTGNASIDYVYLPGTEPAAGANMPYTPAIRVRSGTMVFLSGVTAAPVPHSHPHRPAEFDHLDFSAAAQTEAIMKRLQATMEAAGGKITDIIQVTRFMTDVERDQDEVNKVMGRYWGNTHRPASTSVQIARLATDPRFLLEVEAIAVVPDR
jgi:2-iminobutanoate/2-iminopropanoate deaminase